MMLSLEKAGGEYANRIRAEKGTAGVPKVLIATAEHGHNFMPEVSPC